MTVYILNCGCPKGEILWLAARIRCENSNWKVIDTVGYFKTFDVEADATLIIVFKNYKILPHELETAASFKNGQRDRSRIFTLGLGEDRLPDLGSVRVDRAFSANVNGWERELVKSIGSSSEKTVSC